MSARICFIRAVVLASLCVAAVNPVRAEFGDGDGSRVVSRRGCMELSYDESDAGSQHRTKRNQDSNTILPTGKPKIPVILVQFQDVKDSVAWGTDDFTQKTWAERVGKFFNGNEDGSPYMTHDIYIASLKDYFKQQSDAQFVPEFVFFEPITLEYTRAECVNDRNNKVRKPTLDSLSLQIEDPGVFDGNGDGKVDVVIIVFAGSSSAYSYVETALWAWETTGTYTSSVRSNVKFASSVHIPNQLDEDGSDTSYDGLPLGVAVHEFCHALGLPDFYDVDGNSPGMDVWSLMDYGENINSGRCPTNINAVERDYMGWRSLEELVPGQPRTLHLKALGEGGIGYKLVNPMDVNEYYALECRNTNAVDCDYYFLMSNYWLAGHVGLQVSRVVRDSKWDNNKVNTDASKQKMTILPANNRFENIFNLVYDEGWDAYYDEVRGHLYPNGGENTSITDETLPASVVLTGTYLDQPIYDIVMDEEDHVHLKYMPRGTLEAPSVFSSEADTHQVTLSWSAPANASVYRLEYSIEDDQPETVDSLRNTSYVIDGLDAGTRVSYRVTAMDDEWRNSDASEWQEIDTPTDVITLRVPQSERHVSVYSLSGIKLGQTTRNMVSDFVNVRGIVVLKYDDGSTEKVFVR